MARVLLGGVAGPAGNILVGFSLDVGSGDKDPLLPSHSGDRGIDATAGACPRREAGSSCGAVLPGESPAGRTLQKSFLRGSHVRHSTFHVGTYRAFLH
jgi:hypothetical protein